MADGSWEQFDTVNGQESVAVTHQNADQNAQNKHSYLGKSLIVFEWGDEVETKMDDS
jgi:hypothetical protein